MLQSFHSLSPRERILLGSVSLLIILACYYKLVLEKQITSYMEVKSKLTQAREELAQAERLLGQKEKLSRQSNEAAAKLAPVLSVFNTRMNSGYVLVDLNWQAYQYGVNLDKVKPLQVIDKKHYLEIPLTLHISGAYPSVSKYIKALEELAVPTEIRRADFRPPNKDETINLEEDAAWTADWQQNDDVRVQIDMVLFTDKDAKLNLQEGKSLGEQWLVGRPKAFESIQPLSPLKQMSAPQLPSVNNP